MHTQRVDTSGAVRITGMSVVVADSPPRCVGAQLCPASGNVGIYEYWVGIDAPFLDAQPDEEAD